MAIVIPTDGPIATPIATQKGIFPVTAPTMDPTVTPKEAPRASHRLMDFFLLVFFDPYGNLPFRSFTRIVSISSILASSISLAT
jgi:hypothetical protein